MSLNKRFFFCLLRKTQQQQHLRKPQTGMVFRFLTGGWESILCWPGLLSVNLFFFFVSFFLNIFVFSALVVVLAINQSRVISFSFPTRKSRNIISIYCFCFFRLQLSLHSVEQHHEKIICQRTFHFSSFSLAKCYCWCSTHFKMCSSHTPT